MFFGLVVLGVVPHATHLGDDSRCGALDLQIPTYVSGSKAGATVRKHDWKFAGWLASLGVSARLQNGMRITAEYM